MSIYILISILFSSSFLRHSLTRKHSSLPFYYVSLLSKANLALPCLPFTPVSCSRNDYASLIMNTPIPIPIPSIVYMRERELDSLTSFFNNYTHSSPSTHIPHQSRTNPTTHTLQENLPQIRELIMLYSFPFLHSFLSFRSLVVARVCGR